MGSYLTRVIEVRTDDYIDVLYDETKLPANANIGDTYYFPNVQGPKYKVLELINDVPTWVPTDKCPKSWKLVKSFVNYKDHNKGNYTEDDVTDRLFYNGNTVIEVNSFTDGGGSLKYNYLNPVLQHFRNASLANRGIPKDISEEAKKCIDPEGTKNTYVLLSELQELYNNEKIDFFKRFKESIYKQNLKTINDKLDTIISKLDDKTYESDVDCDEYLSDDIEEFYDIENINDEVTKVCTLAYNAFDRRIVSENVRINYYFI